MFARILDHPNIKVNTDSYLSSAAIMRMRNSYDCTIYSGPIDDFFDSRYGRLEYRSLRFEWRFAEARYLQPCMQINYPNDYDYTRTVEIKHITGQDCEGTVVCYEYPESRGEPFYPIPGDENQKVYLKYKALADEEARHSHPIRFLGRLAEYRYFNMDHVFIRSIRLANQLLGSKQVVL